MGLDNRSYEKECQNTMKLKKNIKLQYITMCQERNAKKNLEFCRLRKKFRIKRIYKCILEVL